MLGHCKLSRYALRKIVECFCVDIDATKTALLTKLNRKTVNRYFLAFRLLIYAYQQSEKQQVLGIAEPDENMQGKFKRPVFGIYERDGSIYTGLALDGLPKNALRAGIKDTAPSGSIVRADDWRGYDGLVDLKNNTHFRISKTDNAAQMDVIKTFCSFTKRRLAKFKGTQRNFGLHLKECEWRYTRSLPQLLASLNHLVAQHTSLMV